MKQVSPCWNESLGLQDSLLILKDLGIRHALAGGCVGREILSLIEADNLLAICKFKLDYSLPWNVDELRNCRQALAFFQKLEDLDLDIDKEEVALGKFDEANDACAQTNAFFQSVRCGACNFLPRDVPVLYRARRKIAQILGRCPNPDELPFRFGPGSTTSVKKKNSTPREKMASELSCSNRLYRSQVLSSYLREIPHWTSQHSTWIVNDDDPDDCWLCEVVNLSIREGILEFVPKNALTYRPIIKPPTLNSFVQQGYGIYMKRRLRAFGIDITDQTRNGNLAKRASITGSDSTLDLTSASDMVAKELVRFLLPYDWYLALTDCRDDSIRFRGKSKVLEMFSSMGNGYTFPLETLVFWALTWSVCKTDAIGVYGDDIICPSKDASDVIRILQVCGFKINLEKLFTAGPFRESCGKDYYFGTDIRPYYQKNLVSGQSLFVLHNFYARQYDFDGCEFVLRLIPDSLRLYGPDGFGDGHLIGEHPRKRKAAALAKGFRGYLFESFAAIPVYASARFAGDHISPLYHVYTRGSEEASDFLNPDVFRIASQPVRMTKAGYPLWGLPGVEEYRRISIYTLG